MALLPDPAPRAREHIVISVDDHVIEPADMFEDRMPAKLAEQAPRIVESDDGRQVWHYEGNDYPNIGLNAVVGRPRDEWSMEPARFDEMRKGCYDIEARIADMDLAGIWASLNFPSLIAGFAGAVFWHSKDPELGLAVLRAWNDWHLEAWAAPYPDRIIPLQLPWLADPAVAAEEVRRNADRGFKAVSFPELPAHVGIPSLHTGVWDPFFAACEETDTVVCLHTGSARWAPIPSPDTPFETITTLFPAHALIAAADWLWSGVPVRFPGLKITLAEGGLGWVAMLADRADFVLAHSASGHEGGSWKSELLPSEVLRRNFWFCSIDDPTAFGASAAIGLDHILVESDYPHADSTWPDTQAVITRNVSGLSPEDAALVTHRNAAKLFRHPLPDPSWLTAA
ncbi:MAG TPA: amidohydrolase family protein [Mycobacteriales bacterium]|nr:amidohydrolase family protein [Mycobacteriales bacterium]